MGLGLSISPEKPLVACITRLVPQKANHNTVLHGHTVRGIFTPACLSATVA